MKMRPITNVKELRAEKVKLKIQLKQAELDMREEIAFFNEKIHNVFGIVDDVKTGISSTGGSIAKLVLPLIVGKVTKTATKGGTTASLLGMAATYAGEFLLNHVNVPTVANKTLGLLSKLKNFRKKRRK